MKQIRFGHIIGVLGLLIFIFLFVKKCNEDIDLKRHAKYTIGVTQSFSSTARNGLRVNYVYVVNQKKYYGKTPYSEKDFLIIPDGRYYVVFSHRNPLNSELLIDKPVSSNISNAPLDGWKELPE